MKNKFKVMISYICAFIGAMISFVGGCMLDSENLLLPLIICFIGIVFLGIVIVIKMEDWL